MDPVDRQIKEVPWGSVSVVLAALVVFFYLPLWRNGFVTWDDPIAITGNQHLWALHLDNLIWMVTTFHTGNWIPLTWFSLALDHQMGGLDPKIFHGINLLFHLLNSLLVFGLCRKFLELSGATEKTQVPAAFLTAILFALHPIHVESVAWATERKDVLYALFYLAALWAYLKGMAEGQKNQTLWLCGGLFTLSLMSKPMAMTLPVILLLFDIWPLRRWEKEGKSILWEKVPFFFLSLAAMGLALLSHEGAYFSLQSVSVTFRVMNSFRTLVFYIGKMLWPHPLVPFYPLPRTGDTFYFLENDLAVVLVLGALAAAWHYRKSMPGLGLAVLFYIVSLLPVLSLVQAGGQAAADRYTYLSSLALFLPLSWGLMIWLSEKTWAKGLVIALLALGMGFMTWNQLAVWRDPISFWESVIQNFPGQSERAYDNLGRAYLEAGRYTDALRQLDQAVLLPPVSAYSYRDRGTVLLDLDRVDEAIADLQKAILLDPNDADPYRYLWFAYRRKKRDQEALEAVKKAVQLDPTSAETWENLGISCGETGQLDFSQQAFEKAWNLDHSNSRYALNLGLTQEKKKDWAEAIRWYQKSLALDPQSATTWFDLGNNYFEMGYFTEAVQSYEKAAQFAPTEPLIQRKLRAAKARAKMDPTP